MTQKKRPLQSLFKSKVLCKEAYVEIPTLLKIVILRKDNYILILLQMQQFIGLINMYVVF